MRVTSKSLRRSVGTRQSFESGPWWGMSRAARAIAIIATIAFVSVLAGFMHSGKAMAWRHLAPASYGTMCRSDLTGRSIAIPPDQFGFGRVQHQPPLPLEAGEYVVTIDDGPNARTTPGLLAILRQYCAPATFMLIGRRAEARPDLVHEILAAGEGIGSHSYTHPDLSKLTEDGVRQEVVGGADAVEEAAWGRPRPPGERRLFRIPGAPGMATMPRGPLYDLLRQQNLVLTGYDISPGDWSDDPPEKSFNRMFVHLPDRGVIVFHDGPSNTLQLLPLALDELRRRHAKIVALQLRNGDEP